MGKSNSAVAHDFYYRGVDRGESHEYSRCSVSYDGNTAISYSTAVAKVIPKKGKRPKNVTTRDPSTGITIVSYYSMSSTTARHISDIVSASPFDVVRVPLERGCRDFTPEDVRDNFLAELAQYADGLNRRENRDAFVNLLGARTTLLNHANEIWAKPLRDRRFRKFEKIDVMKMARELKERNRKAATRRAAETRKVFQKYLKNATGSDYCEFVKVLFNDWYNNPKFPFDYEQRRLLRSKLDKGAAYVWLEGDRIVTSKHVRVSVDEARVLMKAWALGKDMRKMLIGHYTILKYEGDTIQIGCHKIPRENMLALYEAVVGKPFPDNVPKRGEGA